MTRWSKRWASLRRSFFTAVILPILGLVIAGASVIYLTFLMF